MCVKPRVVLRLYKPRPRKFDGGGASIDFNGFSCMCVDRSPCTTHPTDSHTQPRKLPHTPANSHPCTAY